VGVPVMEAERADGNVASENIGDVGKPASVKAKVKAAR